MLTNGNRLGLNLAIKRKGYFIITNCGAPCATRVGHSHQLPPALDQMALQHELPKYPCPTNSAYNIYIIFWNCTTDLRNPEELQEDPACPTWYQITFISLLVREERSQELYLTTLRPALSPQPLLSPQIFICSSEMEIHGLQDRSQLLIEVFSLVTAVAAK